MFFGIISRRDLKKFLLEFTVIFFLMLIVRYVFVFSLAPFYWGILLGSVALITLSSNFFKSKFHYFKSILILMLFLGSVGYVKVNTDGPLTSSIFNSFFGYIVGISNLIIFATLIFNRLCLIKHLRLLMYLLVFIPVGIIWGFYLTHNAFVNVDVILAIFQTNFNETIEYFQTFGNIETIIGAIICLLSVLFVPIVISCKLEFKNSWRNGIVFPLIIVVLGNIVLLYKCRVNIVSGAFFEAKRFLNVYDEFNRYKVIRKASLNADEQSNGGLYVLVIGESHNKANTSAYGYEKETTPWLNELSNNENTILFQNAYSSHVQTTPCVTYAMTAKNQYNNMNLKNSVSLLEAVEASGYETAWISNQLKFAVYDTPITVIAEEANQQIWINGNKLRREKQAYDGKIIEELKKITLKKDMLVVIHLMGSHGAYTARYPDEFNYYTNNTDTDTYNNSLRYNDYVMKEIYDYFKKQQGFQSLIYFSDHGEIPGTGHNTSHFNMKMTEITMYAVFSDEYIKRNNDIFERLKKSKESFFTNDLIFNLVLGIMGTRLNNIYEEENDFTNIWYDGNKDRFMTLHNKVKLQNDYLIDER